MPLIDLSGLEISVWVTREGLLSPVGHDLRLVAPATKLTVDTETRALSLEVAAAALRVAAVVVEGRDASAPLSEADRVQIENNLHREVLESKQFATIVYEGVARDATGVEGALTLRGVRLALPLAVRREGAEVVVSAAVDHTRWGIKPFKALFGALRVKPTLRVEARAAASSLAPWEL